MRTLSLGRPSAIVVGLALLFIVSSSRASSSVPPTELSGDDPQIDLIIVGPGSHFYTIFGHLAVLVRPHAKTPLERGELFNFGVTNFKSSGYLWSFMTGTAMFWGHVKPFERQLKKWNREDRTVTRYPLQLPPTTKRQLYQRFKRMTEPEHRLFRYDTFRENCATRVRDALDEVSGGALGQAWKTRTTAETFRARARHGYSQYPAFLFLLDWGAGRQMDSPRTAWQRAGEPAFFEEEIPTLKTLDGAPMFAAGIVEATRRGPPAVGSSTTWVTMLSISIGMFLLVFAWIWRPGASRAAGTMLCGWGLFCGTFGSLLLLLHWVSLWPETRENWLMAGAFPLDLLLLVPAVHWLRGGLQVPGWVLGYVRIRVCLLVAALCVEVILDSGWGPIGPRVILLGGWLMANRILDQAAQNAASPDAI